eukprot:5021476-Amphidinium_carterae.1
MQKGCSGSSCKLGRRYPQGVLVGSEGGESTQGAHFHFTDTHTRTEHNESACGLTAAWPGGCPYCLGGPRQLCTTPWSDIDLVAPCPGILRVMGNNMCGPAFKQAAHEGVCLFERDTQQQHTHWIAMAL